MIMKKSVLLVAAIIVIILGAISFSTVSNAQGTPPETAIPIPNHSFEAGTFDEAYMISPDMNTTETRVVDGQVFPQASDGRYYAKLSRGTGADAFVATQWIDTGIDVSGKTFRLSLDLKSHNATTSAERLSLQRFPLGDDWQNTTVFTSELTATTSWVTKTMLVTFPATTNGNNSSRIRIVLRPTKASVSNPQPLYYDNIRLEQVSGNSLSCGSACNNNAQCANGLSCLQPMEFNGDHWSDVSHYLSDLGTGQITGWDTYYTPQGERVQHLVKGGVVYSRFGNSDAPTNPWRVINFACGTSGQTEDTQETCCEMSGACGESTSENPNDKLYGLNVYQISQTDVEVHLIRQETGIYAKTIKIADLSESITPLLRSTAGWTNVTQTANFNTFDGDYYLSFSQGNDQHGNRVQHLVKFDQEAPYTTHVFKRIGWLNRGWSNWSKIATSTNASQNLAYQFGNRATTGTIVLVDPLFAVNTHHPYLIRGTIESNQGVFSLANSKLYYYSPERVTYAAGICRNVFTPLSACDADLASATNFTASFRCTDGVAALSWDKPSQASTMPNFYEISICKSGDCTTDAHWQENIKHKISHTAASSLVSSIPGGYTKGQGYDFRIRSAFFENDVRVKSGAWSETLTEKMAGPIGDMDADCDVDFTDYSNYLSALRNPYAHESLFERMIYFFNTLIANMGTRN